MAATASKCSEASGSILIAFALEPRPFGYKEVIRPDKSPVLLERTLAAPNPKGRSPQDNIPPAVKSKVIYPQKCQALLRPKVPGTFGAIGRDLPWYRRKCGAYLLAGFVHIRRKKPDPPRRRSAERAIDRKSTRLNSSHQI